MKNIHVLPTEKCTRLYFSNNGEELNLASRPATLYHTGQHIYITSDEDIDENDYIIAKDGRLVQVSYLLSKDLEGAYKVILTTDQDLIADGVQAIDDDFLKWFVKNPKCEDVKIQKQYITPLGDIVETCYDNERLNYKIIIPIEEPKQHSFCETPEEKCTMNYCDENGCMNRKRELVEPKQETIEEFIKREGYHEGHTQDIWETGVRDGVEWQKEKYTSEEQHIERSLGELEKAYIKGFNEGAAWQEQRMYSEAIEFAEWIRIKDFQAASGDNWIGLNMEYYTTQELFNQFKNRNHEQRND